MTTHPTSDPLTDHVVCLFRHLSFHTYIEKLARLFVSLREGIKGLKKYYKDDAQFVPVSSHFRRIKCDSQSEFIEMTEFKPLAPYFSKQGFSKLVFFAKTNVGRNVFVKFSRQASYPLDFHNFCAGKGFAPKLYGT
jgi:hypothetical protein